MDKQQQRQLARLSPPELAHMFTLAIRCPSAFCIPTEAIADALLASVSGVSKIAKLEVDSAIQHYKDRDWLMGRETKK